MKRSISGFTIVELLIVIVVIAVLAAIVIVTYSGIQNRANDTSVQSDLTNAAKALHMYKATNGSYPTDPAGNNATQVGNSLDTLDLKFSRNAYAVGSDTNSNIFYVSDTQGIDFAIVAKSKSGKVMYISSKTGAVADYPRTDFPISGSGPIKTAVGVTGQHVWGLGNGIWSFWVS